MKASSTPVIVFITLIWLLGCGEDTPTEKPDIEPIKTGISGTTYLNVEHGFKISNLPASGWIVDTRKCREADSESVLRMAFAREDEFSFESIYLTDEVERLHIAEIPYCDIYITGPHSDLATKPDMAKEIMNEWISMLELIGMEVVSRKPVAGVNTTGYEATFSFTSIYAPEPVWIAKFVLFVKNEMAYQIAFYSQEDKYQGLLAYIDPMIASFELLGL